MQCVIHTEIVLSALVVLFQRLIWMTKVMSFSRNSILIMLFKTIVSIGKTSPFSLFLLWTPQICGYRKLMERKSGRKGNTVSLFPSCFKFMWVCPYIVCGCALLCRFWRWRSGVVLYHSDPFLWSRVFLCTWRLLAAYLSWGYQDVQDARLIMWCWDGNSGPHDFTASFLALATDVF